jgi:hypothetical protein
MFAPTLIKLVVIAVNAAAAQDVYKVNYFDNNAPPAASNPHFVGLAPDGLVRIDNPGLTYGNLCAMIYVFDADQQMSECCGCIETHNGLRRLVVNVDLTLHPLTGKISNSGVLKVVSAAVNGAGSSCDPSSNVTPKANLRVWVTHIQDLAVMENYVNLLKTLPDSVSYFYPQTETESSDSALGSTELANLQAQCSFIHVLGSGHGICTCGTGD